jgi:glycosyltransferase involved in cell wall biosynthesis
MSSPRPPLRILVVQPTGDKVGHHGIFTVKLCQALGKLGHAVTVCTNQITLGPYLDAQPAFLVELVGNGTLSFARFDGALHRRPLYYYWGYYRNSYRVTQAALAMCRTRPFDVIYMTDVEFLVASLLLRAHRRRLPPVVMEVSAANFSFHDYPGSLLRKSYKVIQREVFRRTLGREIAACAVLGDWHRERLKAQLRLPGAFPIVAIPEGGDAPPPAVDRLEARRALGVESPGPLFLCFGVLRKDKGIETLIDAVAKVRGEDFRVMIAGFPMEYTREEMIRLVHRAGVHDKVVLRTEFIPEADVPVCFAAADALVLPYTGAYRGAIGPLMKGACAYGRPVIATDVSGMGGLIQRHAIGLVCPPDDPQALAGTMKAFLAMPASAWRQMGEQASAVGRAYSWDAMAERFSELFAQVARGGAAASPVAARGLL